MRKRARSVLTGLLVLCCAFASFVPATVVQADSSGSVGRDIIVSEKSGLSRMAYPVSVPLAAESTTVGEWHVTDSAGRPVSCSVRQSESGTPVLQFLTDLPANSVQTVRLTYSASPSAPGVTQLPLFAGTSYLVYVEKTLEVASYQADNLVRLVRPDGTLILSRTLGADEPMSCAVASPQVVCVEAAKPVSAWLLTMAPGSEQQALSESNDDVYGAVGTDLLVLTFGQLWLGSPSSTSVSLAAKGSTRTIALEPSSVKFIDGLAPGIYRLRSPSPVCVTSGVEEDNVSCVQYPVGTWFAGPSFGQTTVTSWSHGTTVNASFGGTSRSLLLPELGSSACETTIPLSAFVAGKTEWKPIVLEGDGPFTLTTDGNSGNFGLEQYPSMTLAGAGVSFVITSGKLYSAFSSGHFRRLAVVGVQNGAAVTLTAGSASQHFTLDMAQVKIIRLDTGSLPVRVTSTQPVQVFELGQEAHEGIAVAMPLADSSVTVTVAKVSSAIPAASAGTLAGTQAPALAEQPSSGPWQAAWAWIQDAARATGTWIQSVTRTVGTFFASLYGGIRDFFVSGQALKTLQTATQAITDLAVRLFLPLSALVVPILARVVSGFSATPELVAVWMFWIIVVVALIILILVLRPRHSEGRPLPKVTPRQAGQGGNTIEFGLVEQGPRPSTATAMDRLTRSDEKQEKPPMAPAVQPAPAEEPSPAHLESPSVPEIALEPLGFFGVAPAVKVDASAVSAPTEAPVLEFTAPETELTTPESTVPEPTTPDAEQAPVVTAEVPSEVLLTSIPESPGVEVPPSEVAREPLPEPELRPMGQESPVTPDEPRRETPDTVLPLDQPVPAEQAPEAGASQIPVPETSVTAQAVPSEEPASIQETNVPVHEEVTAVDETTSTVQETPEIMPEPETLVTETEVVAAVPQPADAFTPVPSSADLLSRLLEEEQSLEQTAVPPSSTTTGAAPTPPSVPVAAPVPRFAPQPSVFSGDLQLDSLVRDGVVVDAGALAQLFRGGYRTQISKLAVSAKDLQNVPEEMRQLVKLTVVALSPIELSIARDLAMRLEAPGYVGEALLVAKKMGYENYLTTYKNISKNYKDVSIVATTSLKVPDVSAESGGDLISFS
ncbi:MAG TPA: hypothetical protein VN478_06475 [Clostridia bacterium]|nr:hypothetical protein [Clostridia bacterium]